MKRLMRLALAVLVGAALAAVCGTPALALLARTTVELKANPTTSGPMITFGDLFDNAGDAADFPVIAAPRPGQKISLDARSLASLASDHGLVWGNLAGLASVEVTREARVITTDAVADAIAKTLSQQSGGRDLDVHLLQSGIVLNAAANDPSPLQVAVTSFDQQSGRFEAQVSVAGGDGIAVNGVAYEVMSVPVLARPFERGEIIQNADISWIKLRIDTLSRQVLTDPKQLVGLTARRPLRSGVPLMTADIEHPAVVTKGSLIVMTYKVPGMTLTDSGRAQESGAVGDTISVLNERSHRTVQAIVVGANAVELAPPGLAAANVQASLNP
ncbi:MAG: flagellar basal body P-ring formation chaperone FlgA [Alphaproteobacteria bacterium]